MGNTMHAYPLKLFQRRAAIRERRFGPIQDFSAGRSRRIIECASVASWQPSMTICRTR
jgi:hypothetical protein